MANFTSNCWNSKPQVSMNLALACTCLYVASLVNTTKIVTARVQKNGVQFTGYIVTAT